MNLTILSDTHGMHRALKPLKGGDVLVHCGDSLSHGLFHELEDFLDWFRQQKYAFKVFVAGNHDRVFEASSSVAKGACEARGVWYLQDEAITLEGVKFYGSPWTPQFFNWSFMLERHELAAVWAKVPEDTDVLITHGPPYGHGDLAPGNRHVGCFALLERVFQVNPKIHCFGHIHSGHGVTKSDHVVRHVVQHVGRDGHVRTAFVNASVCDEMYRPVQAPWGLVV